MEHDAFSRRRFVGTMAASIAAVWIAGAGEPAAAAGPGVLTGTQRRGLDALTGRIIPAGELPGAREARVVDYIDRALGSFAAEQRPLFEAGLADLDARASRRHPPAASFADLASADAIALLGEIESEKSEFFEAARVATITGFLANPEYGGNAGKVGWRLIGFDDRFVWSAPFGWYDADAPGAR